MLKQRVITALVLAAIFLAFLFAKATLTLQFFAVMVLIAAWEWGRMSSLGAVGRVFYVLLAGLLIGYAAIAMDGIYGIDNAFVSSVLLWACMAWAVFLLWVTSYPRSAIVWGTRGVRAFMGIMVLVPAWLGVAYLRSLDFGAWWILYVVALVACADIGAYFVGVNFGKRKLAPSVSPGKSIEGLLGGLAAVLAFALIVSVRAQPVGMSQAGFVALSVIAGLVSVLGDLVESMVKRHCGIKDSGSILPGHGGVMDRIDGLAAAVPVFALGLVMSTAGV